MARKIVSIYIDGSSLRLMETSGKRINKFAELPLDLGLAKVNADIKNAEIAAKVKELLKATKIRKKKVVVGISGLHCLSRPITLPLLPKAMLEEAVMREAKRLLPIPLEQLYVSWQPIPCPEADKTRIFLVAIPCRIADDLIKALRQVGLKPYLMDIKPVALARVVKEATALIVDVQPSEFDIVIMSDGVPQPIRTIPFPSEDLPSQEKLQVVRNDLERTIEFFNSNNPEKPIDAGVTLFVSGELAKEPELYQALAEELGRPVLPLPSPLQSGTELDLSNYMVNIGLTLKEREKEAGPLITNLNAMPAPYRSKPVSISKVMALPSAISIIGLLALMVMSMQDASAIIASTQSQLDTANHIITHRQTQKKELMDNVAELEKKIADTMAIRNAFVAALNSLDEKGDVINGNLAATVDNLASSVTLTSIRHSTNTLTINGRAPSEAEVLRYARNLDATGRFPEVTISSIRQVAERDEEGGGEASVEGMEFILTLTTEG